MKFKLLPLDLLLLPDFPSTVGLKWRLEKISARIPLMTYQWKTCEKENTVERLFCQMLLCSALASKVKDSSMKVD
jgi:hypothetical protein